MLVSKKILIKLLELWEHQNDAEFERKHPRNEKGQFIDKSYGYYDQFEVMLDLTIYFDEFKHVESEINTWYYKRYKNEKIIEHFMPNYIYYAYNKGFNKYEFYDKLPNIQIDELEK